MKFKKAICTLALAGVLAANMVEIGYAENVTVRLDDKKVECPVPARIENGRTMVPMRAIFEAFGMEVEWNNEEKSVSATKDDTVISLTVGEKALYVNDEKVELDVAAYIDSDTTLVPVRAISESLDASVTWNEEKRRVEIVTKEYEANKDAWKENVGEINLSTFVVTGEGVETDSNVIKITKGGDFTVTGENLDAYIHVDTNEKVKLRLKNVTLTNSNGPAIYFENTAKAFITIVKGTENHICDGEEYSVDAKAAIFANDDIEIKGEGVLYVTSLSHHAIASDDDVKIEEGTLNLVSGKKDGIHAGKDVEIAGGNINIESYGDGIQAEDDVLIADGNVNIKTNGVVEENNGFSPFGHDMGGKRDDMQKGDFERKDGNREFKERTFDEMTPPENGENKPFNEPEKMGEEPPAKPEGDFEPNKFDGEQAPQNGENMPEKPMGMWDDNGGNPMEMWGENKEKPNVNMDASSSDTENESVSTKGIKGESSVVIEGGIIEVDSMDHAIHSAGVISIEDGELKLASQKGKGITGHGDVVINGGKIVIEKSTEGIESKANMTINGGDISIVASDDGINTGGTNGRDVISRNDKDADTGHDLTINGGTIFVNAQGDGLDSNGKMIITGGNIVVEGPTNNGNGALDSGGFIKVDGGELLALGASGMAEVPDSSSGQASFRLVTQSTIPENTKIVIATAKGKEICSYTTKKTGNSIVYSSKELKKGEKYTVTIGDDSYEIEMTDNVTLSGSSAGGFGGFGGGRGPR